MIQIKNHALFSRSKIEYRVLQFWMTVFVDEIYSAKTDQFIHCNLSLNAARYN